MGYEHGSSTCWRAVPQHNMTEPAGVWQRRLRVPVSAIYLCFPSFNFSTILFLLINKEESNLCRFCFLTWSETSELPVLSEIICNIRTSLNTFIFVITFWSNNWHFGLSGLMVGWLACLQCVTLISVSLLIFGDEWIECTTFNTG